MLYITVAGIIGLLASQLLRPWIGGLVENLDKLPVAG